MYAQVRLTVENSRAALVVPASTLVIDSAGVGVVTIDHANRIARTPVKLGRDFGKDVEVVSGLAAEARLVVSPRDDLRDGETVAIIEPHSGAVAAR
jgi:multidrug efflux pump subunit AcrA (membrane-fusion protein)